MARVAMPCHDMVMPLSPGASGGDGKWWHWCWEVERVARAPEEGQGRLGLLQKSSMGLESLSAHQVFDKMSERSLFLKFAFLFGGL